jgi:hypothetical protein
MRAIAIAGAMLLGVSLGAYAADPPNLVGNWTRSASSAAQVEKSSVAQPKRSLVRGAGGDWKMKIDYQEGSSFLGTLTSPAGNPQSIVGTFQPDGKRFVFATDNDWGSGEASSDELQYCWTASNAAFVGAGCATFKHDK